MKIAFNTANLVARVTNYRFTLAKWGDQHKKTVEQTDEKAWVDICREIAAAGYRAIEVWQAHIDPQTMTDARARQYLKIMNDHGLAPIGMAGSMTDETARVCQWLGIDAINGGMWGTTADKVKEISRRTGIAYNFENHPEKSVEEILAKINTGDETIGVCVDTGWLGTQVVDAPKAIRALGKRVRHVHLKDVEKAGSHGTCPLGEGVVDIPGVIRALQDIGYNGWYSWEDEPEDRNPMEIAKPTREWIEKQLSGGTR